jgi:hypothetical protein
VRIRQALKLVMKWKGPRSHELRASTATRLRNRLRRYEHGAPSIQWLPLLDTDPMCGLFNALQDLNEQATACMKTHSRRPEPTP